MNACTCKPGRPEDGWQEVRCQACLNAELAAWSQALENWRES